MRRLFPLQPDTSLALKAHLVGQAYERVLADVAAVAAAVRLPALLAVAVAVLWCWPADGLWWLVARLGSALLWLRYALVVAVVYGGHAWSGTGQPDPLRRLGDGVWRELAAEDRRLLR